MSGINCYVNDYITGSQTCDRYAVIDSVFYCYVIKNDYVTYNMAAADCAAIGGSLPVITSLEVNDILLPIVERIRLMWLSLVQYTAAWRWMDSKCHIHQMALWVKTVSYRQVHVCFQAGMRCMNRAVICAMRKTSIHQ